MVVHSISLDLCVYWGFMIFQQYDSQFLVADLFFESKVMLFTFGMYEEGMFKGI